MKTQNINLHITDDRRSIKFNVGRFTEDRSISVTQISHYSCRRFDNIYCQDLCTDIREKSKTTESMNEMDVCAFCVKQFVLHKKKRITFVTYCFTKEITHKVNYNSCSIVYEGRTYGKY